MRRALFLAPVVFLSLSLVACGEEDDGDAATNNHANNQSNNANNQSNNANNQSNNANNQSNNANNAVGVPTQYAFESRFAAGTSSVSYDGQVARQALIVELTSWIGGLTEQIDSGDFAPDEDGEVVAGLDFYFRFDSDAFGEEELGLATDPPVMQQTWNDVSTGKNLVDKLAGNDSSTDHKDWKTEFTGWSDASLVEHGGDLSSPEGFVTALFEQIEQAALDRVNGDIPTAPDGTPLPVHVTAEGWDLKELTQKFITGAVAFSQGADDYLDDDVEGKGLLSPNTRDGDKAFTVLEHAWDEGYGYFGASRAYGDRSDAEVSAQAWHDADGDGAIDLQSEYAFGHATNASKRDAGAVVATDFSGDAFGAFLRGRAIIAGAGETLTADELTALRAERDAILGAWERAIAATVVHYINDVIKDQAKIGTADYSFTDHAKHWGELKGFALVLQFNPRSPLSDADFAELHRLIGDRPVIEGGDLAGYKASLLEARALLGAAYGFDAANLGDDSGQGGW